MSSTAAQQFDPIRTSPAPERLLAAAEAVLFRDGVQALAIRSIARESGLNSALISYHFGGIGALLGRLVEINVAALCDARALRVAEAVTIRSKAERLEALVAAYLEPLWRTPAVWHPGPARTVIRGLMPLLSPAARSPSVERINRSVEESQLPMLELLPHLSPDALQLRMQLLAGAADELRLRAHGMGLFPLQGVGASGHDGPLRDELIALALAGLQAKP